MATNALLQIAPDEALGDPGEAGAVDVLATGTEAELVNFLTDYRRRHQAACSEWRTWDDISREWDSTFDDKHDELCRRYVVSTIVDDVKFEIVQIGVHP
jgi:hypothetical protein